MPSVVERTVRQAMRDKTFENVYYFFGDDDFLKESTAREFLAAAMDPATSAFNTEVLRGAETSPETLENALNTPPLMAERRVVVIRDVHSLSKGARAGLDAYVLRPAPSTVLLLIAPSPDKADPLLAAHSRAMEFTPLTANRIPRWIVHHAATALGVEIGDEAAELLLAGVGPDLAALAAELDKVASYGAGAPITSEAIVTVVGVRRGESLGDLLDAVADRDTARALALVNPVIAQPRVTLVSVLMALATQFLAIAWGVAMRERAGRGKALERNYFNLLRDTRAYPGRTWGEAVTCWTTATPRWSTSAVEEALGLLLAADHAAKETRVSSDEDVLRSLILALCIAGRSRAA